MREVGNGTELTQWKTPKGQKIIKDFKMSFMQRRKYVLDCVRLVRTSQPPLFRHHSTVTDNVTLGPLTLVSPACARPDRTALGLEPLTDERAPTKDTRNNV